MKFKSLLCVAVCLFALEGCNSESDSGTAPVSQGGSVVGSWRGIKNPGTIDESHGVFTFSQDGSFEQYDTMTVCSSSCMMYHAVGQWSYIGSDSLLVNNTETTKSSDGITWKPKTPGGMVRVSFVLKQDSLYMNNAGYITGLLRK